MRERRRVFWSARWDKRSSWAPRRCEISEVKGESELGSASDEEDEEGVMVGRAMKVVEALEAVVSGVTYESHVSLFPVKVVDRGNLLAYIVYVRFGFFCIRSPCFRPFKCFKW